MFGGVFEERWELVDLYDGRGLAIVVVVVVGDEW
jgi:hypothetical protein